MPAKPEANKSAPRLEPGSFRDRNSRVIYENGSIGRVLNENAYRHWQVLSAAPFFERRQTDGSLVTTREVAASDSGATSALATGDSEAWVGRLEHERIPFLSYAYEWSFSMLKDAALLHLDLLEDALDADLILKDSTHFNVQWRGARPVFIDIPSFESLGAGEAWVGYRQFCCMFLYPLMLQAYKNIPFHAWLRGSIDGVPPDVMNQHMSLRDYFRSGVLTHVYLQASLEKRYSGKPQNVRSAVADAGFHKELIRNNVRGLRKLIRKLEWSAANSEWSHYATNTSYDEEETARKQAFVERAAASREGGWRLAWDLGANTGNYSRIAAKYSQAVVAMDADHLAVDRMYRQLKQEIAVETKGADASTEPGEAKAGAGNPAAKILPLVMNLADPTPALGWRGAERKNLAERGRPELILSLALIHHVVIAANIPVRDFIEWLAGLGASLVMEFVTREDEMVQTLLRNKVDQYSDYTTEYFERVFEEHFQVAEREELKGGLRIIYFAHPRRN